MQRFQVKLPQIVTVATASDRKSVGFLVEETSPDLFHCGLKVEPGDIVVYGNEVLHQRSGSDFRYGTMSLSVEEFPAICRAIIGREFLEETRRRIVRPHPELMSRLLKVHKVVEQLAHGAADRLDHPQVRRALEQRLVHIMVRCLAGAAGIQSVGAIRHEAIMVRFEEYLEANPGSPVYLAEVCAAIGVSERTLRASCEEHLGMGPIRFLTLRRMHLAHRALLRADASNATVTRIVTDQGFWELGRFSAAYRALFGAMPSETLRRKADPIATDLNRAVLASVI